MSQRPEANMSVKKLYVSGVREDHTEDMFRDYFVQFGGVQEVEIITDKGTGKPRGFAFVTFDDYDAVDKCVCKWNIQCMLQRFSFKSSFGFF